MIKTLALRLILVGMLVVLTTGVTAVAQTPDLVVEVGHVEAYPGETGVRLPIIMRNFYEGVAGFDLRLEADDLQLANLAGSTSVIIDTAWYFCDGYDPLGNCTDSIRIEDPGAADFFYVDTITTYFGAVDTAGALASGWEVIEVRSVRRNNTVIRVVGLANNFGGPNTPPIPAQPGDTLVSLLFNVVPISNDDPNRIVSFVPQTRPDQFCFSSPEGQCIGLEQVEVLDTSYYRCVDWLEDLCLSWERVTEPPFDSMVVWPDTVNVYPIERVVIEGGSIAVQQCGLSVADPSPVDMSSLVDLLFAGGTPPEIGRVDADCNCSLDPIDLSILVDYLFAGQPLPGCGP